MSEGRQACPANPAEEAVQAGAFGDDGVLYKVVPANAENATLTCLNFKMAAVCFQKPEVVISGPRIEISSRNLVRR